MKVRPFIEQVTTQISNLSPRFPWLRQSTPVPEVNPQWQQFQDWHRKLTPDEQAEQEASYADDSWLNSKPPHVADMDTVAEMPVVNKIMSHIFDEPAQFAQVSGPLLATEIRDKSIVPRVPTKDLHAPKQTTDALRPITTSDPYLPSVRMTPNKLAIVPRQRATAQLPPHMRLDEDIADSQERVMPVEKLINGAIVTFHQEHQRLPDSITVSLIRFYQHWLDHHYSLFTYKAKYGDVQIPIQAGAKGEFLVDEVRLD